MVSLLHAAMKKAGKNLTWAKVADNLRTMRSVPGAGLSDGDVGFGKNKQYAAKNLHVMKLQGATTDTPKDANGLFNGCPAPVNCWIPQLTEGKEWFPIPN
jgi:hypothetical protein